MAQGRHIREEDASHNDRQPHEEQPKPKKDRPKLRFLRGLGILFLLWIGVVMLSELGKASGIDEAGNDGFAILGGLIFLFIVIAGIILHQFFRLSGRGFLDKLFNRGKTGEAKPPESDTNNPS